MPKPNLDYGLLESVLVDLNHLSIHPSRLVPVDCSPVTGGYGTVTVARLPGVMDPATRSDFLVAVKTLRPVGNSHERSLIAFSLARELKVWQSLEHPNILYLFGFFLNDDKTEALLISPYIKYGHIEEYIQDENPNLAKRVDLAVDVASGLDYLHSLRPPICHGDIKTRNILVNEDIRAVICDFGVAKALNDPAMPSGLTTTESFKGSVRYYSYELVVNQKPRKSLKSDIWAYGCVLLEIFFRKIPYASYITEPGIYIEISKGRPPADITTLTSEPFGPLRGLLTQCWQLAPQERPSAGDLIDHLHQFSGQLTIGGWSSVGNSPSLSSESTPRFNSNQSLPSPVMSPGPDPGVYRGLLTFTQFDALQRPKECHVRTIVQCSTTNLQFPTLWPTVLNIHPANYKAIPETGVSSLLPSLFGPVFTIDADLQYYLVDPYDHAAQTGPMHFLELWETFTKNGTYAVSYLAIEGQRHPSAFIIYSMASPTSKKKWLEAAFFECSSSTAPSTPVAHRSPAQSLRLRRGESWSL